MSWENCSLLRRLLHYEAFTGLAGAVGVEEGGLFLLFGAEEGSDEFEAEVFGETEDEDDLVAGFLDLAVGGVEEEVVTAAGVDGVGVEVGGAVVVGHHAAFLAGLVAVGHDEVVLLEGTGEDVDVAVLVEDRLGLDAKGVCEDVVVFYILFHFNKCCEEGAKRLAIFTCKTLFTHITRVNKKICSCSVRNTMQKYTSQQSERIISDYFQITF